MPASKYNIECLATQVVKICNQKSALTKTKIVMKFFSKILVWLSLSSLFFAYGCGGDAQQSLIVYTTHGEDLFQKFIEKFEAENPNVIVEVVDMGSQEVLDRIRSEKANPQASLWWGAPAPLFMQAVDEGLLQAYRPSWADQVDAVYHDPNDFWYGNFLTPEVIGYNTDKLTLETAPQDWDDLIKPEWKDRIVIRNPMASGTMRAIYISQILRFYGDEKNTEQGFEWLRKLDANTASYAAMPTLMYEKLARGGGEVTLWNMPDMMLQKNDNGYPFGYIIPKSGTVVVTDCMGIVANAKAPELAKKFYEFVTSEESMIRQAVENYRIPSRKDIPKEKLPEWMREPINVTPVDWKIFAEKSEEWMRHWDENIRSQEK